MSIRARICMVVAAVLLGGMFLFPLWRITLIAPQYPEGLGMLIELNSISGINPHDLNNINELNHYIGMKIIDPSSIPELRIMPWIVGALMLIALIAALRPKRGMILGWLIGMTAFAVAGGIDFWRWTYDYGHNLDFEHAIIKIPGAVYQPPLIGSKQILNFTATSWPTTGTWFAVAAFAMGVIALLTVWRRNPQAKGYSFTTLPTADEEAAKGAVEGTARASTAAYVSTGTLVLMITLLFGSALLPNRLFAQTVPVTSELRTIVVGSVPDAVPTITEAIAKAQSGDRIVVMPGVYREPTIVIDKPLTIEGRGEAVLDGEFKRQIMTVQADDVTIRNLRLRNVGTNSLDEPAAIKVLKVHNCTIADNHIENGFFGIYLAGSIGCRVLRNTVQGQARDEGASGNGIHLWTVQNTIIFGNQVSGHRDGIYFEFVKNTRVRGNVSEGNIRYGLHFMYSDDCQYENNVFRRNLAGVAVMYTHRVSMTGNRFEHNWGSASYGLLFKEIVDSRVERNVFLGNTVGMLVDGANRIVAVHNVFRDNGWAIKLLSNTDDGRFEANNFIGNTFNLALSGGQTSTRFVGNYWDDYRGYDLDRDGIGDVPFRPLRIFSMVVSQNPPALILLRSVFVRMLDVAERVLPILTPASLSDDRPLMRPLT